MERVVFVCNDNISCVRAALPPQDHHNVAVTQGVTHAVSVDYRQTKDKPVYAKYTQAHGKPEQAVPFIHSHIVLLATFLWGAGGAADLVKRNPEAEV
jgi:hypothetical protein